MSYLDIDEILSEDDRVPVVFNVRAADMGKDHYAPTLPDLHHALAHTGHLNPNLEENHLPEGERIEVPLWLAEVLQKTGVVREVALKAKLSLRCSQLLSC